MAQAGNTIIYHPNGYGINDTTIEVRFGSAFTTSPLTVQAFNDCGGGNIRSLTISRNNPSTPGAISGPANVCEQLEGVRFTYSVPAVPGVIYNWTLPSGLYFDSYTDAAQSGVTVYLSSNIDFTSVIISVSAYNNGNG